MTYIFDADVLFFSQSGLPEDLCRASFRLRFVPSSRFLVVYNVLVMFPSIRQDPTSRAALKYGTIFVTVVIAKLVLKLAANRHPRKLGLTNG